MATWGAQTVRKVQCLVMLVHKLHREAQSGFLGLAAAFDRQLFVLT